MDTFIRILLIIVGGFFTYTGYSIASRYRKTEKLIGGLVVLIIGAILVLYALGLVSSPLIK
jgi:uncharacterized membrane protein YeaQ/YmgE (transglycosylase-associated protein family)